MRPILELFRGTPEEIAAKHTLNRLNQKSTLSPREQHRLSEAQKLTRRLFLRQAAEAAGGAALTGVGVLAFIQSRNRPSIPENPPITDLYKEVVLYRNRFLPRDLIQKVADDLASQDQFPSLVSSGQLLAENQQTPQIMSRYSAMLPQSTPFSVGFAELGRHVAQLEGTEGAKATNDYIRLRKKDSGEVVTFLGVEIDPTQTKMSILLNITLIDLKASPWLLRLMVAKEASHPYYFPPAKKQLEAELEQIYELPQDTRLRNILFATSVSPHEELRLPDISPNFPKTATFIDFAGFGHIALDAASMRRRGLLTHLDQKILGFNFEGIDDALKTGIIVSDPNNPNKYRWSNAAPFSQAWFNIMENVSRRNA